ncbi:hypothetical protein GF337_01990 [candidate division KSB1 bacterium]|nr:hypothetical protein [candidate division KSB1 bacterium]
MAQNEELPKTWIDDYLIHSYEIDLKGQVSIPVLCRYMQESAWHHAEHLEVGYSHLSKKNMIWVLAQQYFKIVRLPQWGEKIEIHTWPSGRGKLSYYRDFRVIDHKERIIAAATTRWFALDIKSRRPQNIDHLFEYDFDAADHAVSHKFKKIEPSNDVKPCREFSVLYSDLDVNGHVNNTHYIDWILDSFTLKFRKLHILKEIEINFLAEAGYDDRIVVSIEESKNGIFINSLKRASDDREISRARSKWSSIL